VLGLTNVILSGNVATQANAGALQQIPSVTPSGSTSATLTNVTIADNTSVNGGAGINTTTGTVILSNTIIANNRNASSASNCGGSAEVTSQGFNLVFPGPGCGLSLATNDLVDRDPALDALARTTSPGLPLVHLLPGSAAIDAGNPANPLDGQGGRCAATDVRNTARQDGDGDGAVRCDNGAFELSRQSVDIAVRVEDAVTTAAPGGTLSYRVTVSHQTGLNVPNIRLAVTFAAPLVGVSWTCAAAPG
jgi:hypothetical protein